MADAEKKQLDILLIEDDPGDARLLREMLDIDGKYNVVWVEKLEKGILHCNNNLVDAVILDFILPDDMGIDALNKFISKHPSIPVVITTGMDDDLASDALKSGAQDYISKNKLTSDVVVRAIRYAIHRKSIENELRETSESLNKTNKILKTVAMISSNALAEDHKDIDKLIAQVASSIDIVRFVMYEVRRDGACLIWDKDGVTTSHISSEKILPEDIKTWAMKNFPFYGNAGEISLEIPQLNNQALFLYAGSIIIVPMVMEQEVWGFLAFCAQADRVWSIGEVDAISILGRLMAIMINKWQQEEKIATAIRQKMGTVADMLAKDL